MRIVRIVFILSLAALVACAGLTASAITAAVDDPRIAHDLDVLSDCRAVGRDVQIDAGHDASLAVQQAGFHAYCVCTVEAGIRDPKGCP